ncbi:hypothetical protein D9757_001425 [Collybiopsis confluens]|uniref:Uncharacterized protein n=1 Tax=Collybiopsis confluens TaxID=2823264 RepID=A0A8H5HZX5_9AGAR|nr:hypothetical protein D9757_001425 [Collybiopsis confluens]
MIYLGCFTEVKASHARLWLHSTLVRRPHTPTSYNEDPHLLVPPHSPFRLVRGQTATVVDVDGDTIVEVVTTDRQGLPVTSTIQTILASTTSTTSTISTPTRTTTQQQGGGVVGQPPPTTDGDPHGPTPYTYTTVIGTVTTAIQAIFTPSFTTPIATPAPATGTILDYSSWLAQFGATTTATTNGARPSFGSSGLGHVLTAAAGIMLVILLL